MAEVNSVVEEKTAEYQSFSENIKGELRKSIEKIYRQNRNDEVRFENINSKLKGIDRQLSGMKVLHGNLEELMNRVQNSDRQAKFLSEGIPTLIHLHVCEAIKKTLKTHK